MLLSDIDTQETREWLESLDAVLEADGPERARYLLEQLLERARRAGGYVPYSASTAYATRSPRSTRTRCRATRSWSGASRSLIRWNAIATVLQANKESSELGGHIASFQSAATLYEVGFNHFWHAPEREARRRPRLHPGPLLAGHLRARLPRGPASPRSSCSTSARRSTATGLSSYPHPWLMPDFWQFPTVSMGLGPIMAIYQARFMKYLDGPRASPTPTDRKVWAFMGDGEMDEPESMGAISLAGAREARQPDLRHQLQPAAPRRPGARQRQDHPGARDDLPRRRLERDQGDLGLALGPAARRPTAATGCSQRMEEAVDGEYQAFKARDGAYVREHFFGTYPELREHGRRHDRRRDLGAEPRRPRPAEGLRRLRRGREAQGPADGDPRQDDQGLRHGRGRRGPEHHPPGRRR